MVKSIICASCGADNEFVDSICLFCKSPLVGKAQDVLTDDELVEKTAEWIDRTRELSIEFTNQRNLGKHFGSIPPKIELTNAEIRYYAKRYLSVLAARSHLSDSLTPIYKELSHRFEQNITLPIRGNIVKPEKNSNFLFKWLLVAIFLVAIVLLLISSVGEKKQIKKIERLNNEISILIETKQYKEALAKADELVWTYVPETHSKQLKATNIQREMIKQTVKELIKKDESKIE